MLIGKIQNRKFYFNFGFLKLTILTNSVSRIIQMENTNMSRSDYIFNNVKVNSKFSQYWKTRDLTVTKNIIRKLKLNKKMETMIIRVGLSTCMFTYYIDMYYIKWISKYLNVYFSQKRTFIFDPETSCSTCTKDDPGKLII